MTARDDKSCPDIFYYLVKKKSPFYPGLRNLDLTPDGVGVCLG
jgi:hypothetical protein